MHWRGTLSLGSPRGIAVRLHWFCLLFGGFELLRPLFEEERSFLTAVVGVCSLCVAVFLREWARCMFARRLGLDLRPVVLGPFGALEDVAASRDPAESRVLALAAPAVQLSVVLLLGVYVLATDQWNSFLFRFSPAAGPADPLAIFWGVNFDLLLLHLLPCLPFDCGRLLHSIVWERTDEETALAKVVLSGRFCAVACILAGLFGTEHTGILFTVGLLCLIAGELERRAFQSRGEEPDWLRGEQPVARGRLRRWFEERQELLEAQKRESAARERVAEEAELDELLGKVHRVGLDGLTRKERKFLARVGKKYRDRNAPPERSRDE